MLCGRGLRWNGVDPDLAITCAKILAWRKPNPNPRILGRGAPGTKRVSTVPLAGLHKSESGRASGSKCGGVRW